MNWNFHFPALAAYWIHFFGIYIYMSISLYFSLSLSLYIYIYIYIPGELHFFSLTKTS